MEDETSETPTGRSVQRALDVALTDAAYWRRVALIPRSQWQARTTLALLLFTTMIVVFVRSRIPEIPEPITCPQPTTCPPPIVCESTDTPTHSADEEDGFWVHDGDGGHRREWPDATGYPAERFERDCREVCAVPDGYGDHARPGRALTVDPPHLVCVCLHPDSHGGSWAVDRWVGWEQVR